MVTVLRRCLVIAALMFWQGGFTFYAAVVVPTGQRVLGHAVQAEVTREVTGYLNLAAGIALALLAWDVVAAPDPARGRRRARGISWVLMLATLFALVWLRARLETMLDQNVERPNFRTGHRWYLWVSTIQWAVALAFIFWTIRAWRAADRLDAGASEPEMRGAGKEAGQGGDVLQPAPR